MVFQNNYTFITITYNFQSTIIRHLNSITTQIRLFNPKSVEIIIIDDFSSDETPNFINRWVEENSYFFSRVKVQLNSVNVGIKENYIFAMRHNNNPYYKLLAGDDYYIGNVFEFMEFAANYDVVFSPILTCINDYYFKDYMFSKILDPKSSKEIVNNLIFGINNFNAPGAYINPRVFKSGLSEYLESYLDRSHEDLPSWFYLFVISKKSYGTYLSPICLYCPSPERYNRFIEPVRYLISSIRFRFIYFFLTKKYNLYPENFKLYLRILNKS